MRFFLKKKSHSLARGRVGGKNPLPYLREACGGCASAQGLSKKGNFSPNLKL